MILSEGDASAFVCGSCLTAIDVILRFLCAAADATSSRPWIAKIGLLDKERGLVILLATYGRQTNPMFLRLEMQTRLHLRLLILRSLGAGSCLRALVGYT